MRLRRILKSDKKIKFSSGFTLIEVLVAIGIFLIITVPIYMAYSNVLEVIIRNQWRSDAIQIVQNEIETVRNFPYERVGIQGGYPIGDLLAQKTVDYQGTVFNVYTTVRNIDDSFDGRASSTPNDTAPADYKLVEFRAECITCPGLGTLIMTTSVAPKNLESASNNGSLFINVFDSYGEAISGANIEIINNVLNPHITIGDTSNTKGELQLVDIPTSTSAYEIKVWKTGYSSEQTYPLNEPSNPNPVKPHATIAEQQVSSVSFTIDKTGSLNLSTTDEFCEAIPDSPFKIEGSKLIGSNPDVLKYSISSLTDSNGVKSFDSLEWDSYMVTNQNTDFNLSGYSYASPIQINPDTIKNFSWIMSAKNPSALLITVKDQNGNLVNDAKITLEKNNFKETIYTKHRNITLSDWSGGNYSSQSGNIDADSIGEIKLISVSGFYPTSSEWLISNTIDFKKTNTNFNYINWNPIYEPAETGEDSIKFQIATNNDGTTWNFVGLDGTPNTFYTASSTHEISQTHSNSRYLRYKVLMITQNENFTPLLQDLNIDFTSSCLPSGQAFIDNLINDIYTITVEKSGFQIYIDSTLDINSAYKEYTASLAP